MKIEKEFIPYEQALSLKELGFDEPCMMNHYGNERLHIGRLYLPSSFGKGRNSEMHDDSLRDGDVTAILYQQAFRWFREEHKIESFVNSYWSEEDSSKRSYYANYNYGSDIFFTIDKACKSHEEAELECLKKLIEIVKQT